MNKKDKDKLFILAFILVYIGLFIAFCLGTVKIPFTWLIISVLLIHYVILLPRADRLYYQVHESQIGCSRFIPIWNEISIFSGKWAIMSLISYVLVTLSALALFVPSSFLADYLGVCYVSMVHCSVSYNNNVSYVQCCYNRNWLFQCTEGCE